MQDPNEAISMHQRVSDCRMYENKFPEVDQLVVVKVKAVESMGAYVELLEYNGLEGMILLSELSRQRIRSMNKVIRKDRQEVVTVLRVDKEKGYIDLSKRLVSPEDVAKAEDRYNKSRAVHNIMKSVSAQSGVELELIYEHVGWPLYKKLGHAYDAFRKAVAEPDIVVGELDFEKCGGAKTKQILLATIGKRMTPHPVRIRTDLDVTCFTVNGIEGIKKALRAGAAFRTADVPLKIKLIAPPLYVITAHTVHMERGLEVQRNATKKIEQEIRRYGGTCVVKEAARVVSEKEHKELSDLMRDLERKAQQVSGDDDADD